MLTVIAEINTHSQVALEKVVAALKQVTEAVRAEEGCEAYELYIDEKTLLDMQTQMPYSIVMYEKWQSEECLKHHMQTVHMQAYQAKVSQHVRDVKIRILKHG